MKLTKAQLALLQKRKELEKRLGHAPTLTDWKEAGVTRNAITWAFGSITGLNEAAAKESGEISTGSDERLPTSFVRDPAAKRFVITSAQNNTAVFKPFYQAILNYCKANAAQLIVIPVKYRFYGEDTKKSSAITWPVELREHYLSDRLQLHKKLEVRGDVSIVATAKNPLSGLENISKDRSAIFGHGQLQMKMIATPKPELPKMLHTTGSVSEKNYSDTKAGVIGDFNHSFSALVVELDGDTFHIRQLNADDKGIFYDLNRKYTKDGVEKIARVNAIIHGDIHSMFLDVDVKKATWTNKDSIVNVLNPVHEVLHDVVDFYSRNHHHKHDPFVNFAKYSADVDNVKTELDGVVSLHNEIWSRPDTRYHYVSSNHHDALTRWLKEADPKGDPRNALIYHELMSELLRHTKMTPNGSRYPDPFESYVLPRLRNRASVSFHGRDERFFIHNIDLNNHGDRGANGARGSAASFARAGYKTVTGHSHTPQIEKGAYVVGCSCELDMEYNAGYSSWLHTHCVIYPNGKRALINIIKGKWRL